MEQQRQPHIEWGRKGIIFGRTSDGFPVVQFVERAKTAEELAEETAEKEAWRGMSGTARVKQVATDIMIRVIAPALVLGTGMAGLENGTDLFANGFDQHVADILHTHFPTFMQWTAIGLIGLSNRIRDTEPKDQLPLLKNWTNGLTLLNIAAFAVGNHAPEIVQKFAFTPNSIFFHADFNHLLGNMIALQVIGRNVEQSVGSDRMLLAYLGSGLAGSVANILSPQENPLYHVTVPIPSLGASGADMGLLGLSIASSLKDKALGKLAVLGTAAALLLKPYGVAQEGIDQLAHQVGFLAGVVPATIAYGVNWVKGKLQKH